MKIDKNFIHLDNALELREFLDTQPAEELSKTLLAVRKCRPYSVGNRVYGLHVFNGTLKGGEEFTEYVF